MAISSLGAGSGIDLNGILTSLMSAERQPLLALKSKEASFQAKISALGNLRSSLSSLQTASQSMSLTTGQTANSKFASFRASVADTSIATTLASAGAVAGSYSLEVSSLAVNQRLTTPDSTDTTNSATLAAGLLAGGTLKIELGTLTGSTGSYAYAADSARELNITVAANSTLEQVRDAINTAASDSRVSATIITGTNGKQLVLSTGETGLSNVMQLSGIDGLNFDPTGTLPSVLSQDPAKGGQEASNAAFSINGIAGTSSSNSVTGALDGVTLELLKKTAAGTPTTLTVTKDSTTQLNAALTSFVKAYNESAGVMKNLGYYDPATKQAGALQGNSTLRGVQNEMRSLLQTRAGGTAASQTLSDLGVEIQRDGTLKLDSVKLNKAIEADFVGVGDLVSKVGSAFNTSITNATSSSGSISSATESTNRLISDINKRSTVLQSRLVDVENRYRKQFSSLDSIVTGLKNTSTYLTGQLANLPGSYAK
ncbi:MAG: flagellar filament capping protein FliD [Rhodocyclaceae bacterium]|nr:flagellar filament capping protein FliD [Rhodocyclaceae bacterium]